MKTKRVEQVTAVVVLIAVLRVWTLPAVAGVTQKTISRIEAMDQQPSPYVMRDWRQVAHDYDDLVFDFTLSGDYLPLIWWDMTWTNYDRDVFGMPSYVGHQTMTGGSNHESINCMGAVLGASLSGIDKSDQNGQNWVIMMENYFNLDSGENLVLNRSFTDTGNTFWYEIFPSVLFGQLTWLYPDTGILADQMETIADRWYDACVAMGGSAGPWSVPDFNYTAFDFDTMSPVYNGRWREPDAAAGVAWLEYMAYIMTDQGKYLNGADWGLGFLETVPVQANPLYECLLPYGAYTAARMNAELGRGYDVQQLLDWCFTPGDRDDGAARGGWGVIADEPWGGYDVDGLVGSSTNTGGYSFAMNTFHWAGALVPIARYDQGYARAMGKWMLNLANSARFFYANSLDGAHQSGKAWADTYDTHYAITYEGFRKVAVINDRLVADHSTSYGVITNGDYKNALYEDNDYEVIREELVAGGRDALQQVWRLTVTPGTQHVLYVDAWYDDAGDADSGFQFAWGTTAAGPYTTMFTVDKTSDDSEFYAFVLPANTSGDIYIRAQDTNRVGGNYLHDYLYVDDIHVRTTTETTPYGTGDGESGYHNDGRRTDFALYGAAHVGMLGAIVDTTNVPMILQLDCLATDTFHDDAYPTYLYYNPYNETKTVNIEVGSTCRDIYDAVSQTFLRTNVRGQSSFSIGPDAAVLLVLAPAHGTVTLNGTHKLIDGIIVDYQANLTYTTCAEKQASPQRLPGDYNMDCRVDEHDAALWIEDWLSSDAVSCFPPDINKDQVVDLFDFAPLQRDWQQDINP